MSGNPESPQIQTRTVVIVMAGFLLLVLAVALGFAPAFRGRIGIRHVRPQDFPTPSVSADERQQRMSLEARQRRQLAGADGRMSITQAMQAIAAKGPAAFDPVP